MNRQTQIQKLIALVEPALGELDLELLELQYVPHKRRSQLRITIDRPDRAISIDDCQTASRHVAQRLDLDDPLFGSYNLEVSSPGFKRILRVPKDLPRFIGHRIRVSLGDALNGRKVWIGILTSVSDSLVLAQTEAGDLMIPLSSIARAHLDD